jgi:hypothetical protein
VPALLVALVLGTLLGPGRAHAQLRQYTNPGQIQQEEVPDRKEMRDRMAAAPWHLGRWRFQPRLSLGDVEYSNNVFDDNDVTEQQSELRAGAAAGLDGYVPLGRDFVGVTYVRPSYAWWRDHAELRRLNWSYGTGLFGLFNRLSTGLSARRTEVERPLNNELRIPTSTRNDAVSFDARAGIRGPWQVFTAVSSGETTYPTAAELDERAPNLAFLARTEDIVSLGVAYDVPDTFNLGVGWRKIDTHFADDPAGRSSSGQSPFVQVTIPGNRLQLDGEVGRRRLEFREGSNLRETEETVGSLGATLNVGSRTHFSVYGSRQIVYSGVDASGYFTGERSGVALGWGETQGVRVRVFAETGSDSFASGDGVNAGRVDDATAYGLGVEVPLRWGLELRLGYTDTEIDSNFDQFDRSLTGIQSTLRLALPDFPF